MADMSYTKRASDRREGRQLRSLSGTVRLTPYIRRRRSDAICSLSDTLEVSGIEKWLREKRNEGWSGLGFVHLMVAAYVRTVSLCPGINRFVSGRRLFARNDIQVVMNVKRTPTSPETAVKVSFSPSDTVFDVYRTLSAAVDQVRAEVSVSDAERIAETLIGFPRPMLRLIVNVLRWMDFFDWLPRRWLDASPYHASLQVLDMGTLGIVPAEVPLSDFGTTSMAMAFGAKRKVRESDGAGAVERHYVDYRLMADGRIADTYYFASALKCLKYFLRNPGLLELPPDKVEDDVN